MKRPGLKKASKQQTLKQKHKIAGKIREHNRQQRKLLKKGKPLNAGSRFTKRTRDPGIPANCPFSDEILQEAHAYKERQAIEKEEMRDKQRKWQQMQFKRKRMGYGSVEEMLAKAESDRMEHEKKEREKIEDLGAGGSSAHGPGSASGAASGSASGQNQTLASTGNSKKDTQNFWRQVNNVINEADIVLEILDARDPEGTRCKAIEKSVNSVDGKKLVLVLNKIDLIPATSAKAWLKFYRRTLGPCIAFRATTQKQKSNISQKNSAGKISKDVSGVSAVLSYLANYGRLRSEDHTSKVRTAVTVGIVGLPNVGKSSIINTLKRNKSCRVGAEPGITRNLQTVQIDSHVKLIDSPGVVLPSENKGENSVISKVLLNALHAGSVENCRTAAVEILNRVADYEKLAFLYRLDLPVQIKTVESPPDCFLACLARRKGWLKKGARPDVNAACRFLLKQWTSGALNFHTMPPKLEGDDENLENSENMENMGGTQSTTLASTSKYSASIKSTFGEELDTEMLARPVDSDDDGMGSSDQSLAYQHNILFKVQANQETEYKVDLEKSGNRKRKIQFEDEQMDEGTSAPSENTFISETKSDDTATPKTPTIDVGRVTTRSAARKSLQSSPDDPQVDQFSTNFTDKNRRKLVKKRKKVLKKSNLDMEPVVEELAKMMGGI